MNINPDQIKPDTKEALPVKEKTPEAMLADELRILNKFASDPQEVMFFLIENVGKEF